MMHKDSAGCDAPHEPHRWNETTETGDVIRYEHIAGHVELARVDGSTVVVTWYGPADRYQWIVWGDSDMTTVTHTEDYALSTQREHTYAEPGTYTVGVRGDINWGDKYRECFTVTVGK
jgi:hypothetical protein